MKKLVLTAILCAGGLLHAQNNKVFEQLDSVLIATKIPVSVKNSGKVTTTISAATLERSAGKSIAQLINEVSGIEINGSRSNDGQNLGYFIRGGRNRQVVILIDGVPLTDPSQISNDYDLRLVPSSNIEKIEIIKGASSVLYGSGAATAVISITTKKAAKDEVSATITSTVGSNRASEDSDDLSLDAFTNFVTVNGTLNRFFYNATFGNRYTDGISAVEAPENEPAFESDVFNRYNGRLNLGYHITDDITISQFISFDKFKADFDEFSYVDAENRSITEQIKTGGHFEWKYAKGTYVFNDSYTWIEREIASSFPAKYDSKSYAMDNYLTYNFSDKLTALVGLNLVFSSFNSFTIPFGETSFSQDVSEEEANFDIIDPYLNLVYQTNFGLHINAGARVNIHSVYDTNVVYNLNPSYAIDFGNTTLKFLSSYSTAYITPSLFQLYDPLYGNEELQPEEDRTIEGGIAFFTGKDFRISAVYFNRNEMNYVDFVTVDPDLFIFQYRNIDEEFETNGFEVELYKQLTEQIDFSANYTNTQADERFALRIPEHKINADLTYDIMPNTSIGVQFQFNSERTDSFFNPTTFENETITLDSYSLTDVNFSSQLSATIRVFANVSNIFNTEYEELYRFQTLGRNVRIGFTISL
ncbi:MAG: TonB-dependent receptor [Flavobacteriales bacterium]|jgi:vitamin B12 transporter|uniref:TonB-dependent receptor plug domain-containing protein n=1 Tax=Candidatus Ulvibacter alkanivorans TaxID=2267620 RepID=UPI000DF1E3F7|nr:TonB-dependent receptor [Candidatus Ulvibacter alkanivorans]MCH2488833.1 TonB-dependent receptor [Flavobacteriales bacterium]